MTNDTIRTVCAADLNPLADMIDTTGLFPGQMLHLMAADHLQTTDPTQLWYCLDDGTPVAIIFAQPEPMTEGTWNMLLIAVHPARQGQGIGQRLVAKVEQVLTAKGARLFLVETSGLPEFDRTRRFYDSLGYTRTARIADFYDVGEDKIVFIKKLS